MDMNGAPSRCPLAVRPGTRAPGDCLLKYKRFHHGGSHLFDAIDVLGVSDCAWLQAPVGGMCRVLGLLLIAYLSAPVHAASGHQQDEGHRHRKHGRHHHYKGSIYDAATGSVGYLEYDVVTVPHLVGLEWEETLLHVECRRHKMTLYVSSSDSHLLQMPEDSLLVGGARWG